MAYVIYKSGKKQTINPNQALKIWEGIKHPESLDDKQLEFLNSIRGVWLNWHKAPDDYVQENLSWIVPLALNDWAIDSRGRYTRPQSNQAWQFAKRWGLWEAGGPTVLVRHPSPPLVIPNRFND